MAAHTARRRRLLALLTAAGLCLAIGCSSGGGRYITIGFPASLTGRFAAIGTGGRNALVQFRDWTNANGGIRVGRDRHGIRLLTADDTSEVAPAVALFSQFLADGADFMMASYSSGLTGAQAPLAEQSRILTFAWGAAADSLWEGTGRHLVGVLTPGSLYDRVLIELLAGLDPVPRNLALLHEDDPFSNSAAEGIRTLAAEHGLSLVSDASYASSPTDLTAELNAAAAANPDALLLEGHFADGALAARQAGELGLNLPLLSFGSAAATTTWPDEVGAAAEDTVGVTQWEGNLTLDTALYQDPRWTGPRQTPAEFAAWYRGRFGSDPDFRAMAMFTAGLALSRAIEAAGTLETEAVRAQLVNLDLLSTYGSFRLDDRLRQVGHEMAVIQWQNGAKEVVAPAGAATATLVYPRPAP